MSLCSIGQPQRKYFCNSVSNFNYEMLSYHLTDIVAKFCVLYFPSRIQHLCSQSFCVVIYMPFNIFFHVSRRSIVDFVVFESLYPSLRTFVSLGSRGSVLYLSKTPRYCSVRYSVRQAPKTIALRSKISSASAVNPTTSAHKPSLQ